ncbi:MULTISPECIES: transcriptional regulator [unclassified Methylophaga]|jgi:mRNA-degrading endonuclease RelE of RelBE toxin-antitoxin system|uniref:transcriptional regulator n=1 Tax=unclassified Methylophaga TaxID=2629249 RepID=UPI00259CC2AE|nr:MULTISPECIES: transcriptional regulator [unclassified Methylophaga]|tara:strand:- start:36067 stop:36363 length:297 start_codon:yes stop_codon:yes gene_type:complete
MRTVIETPTFCKHADKIWDESERLDFISYIAQNPEAGDVIPEAEGARKVRWAIKGSGKRGGARIIYFNEDAEGTIYLIMIYKKSDTENITSSDIKKLS